MWTGINRKTIPFSENLYSAEYQANTRMDQEGELQRRWGYLTTGIAQQSGIIYNFATANIHGNIHTMFNTGNGTTIGGGTIIGVGPQVPPPQKPPKKKKKPIDPDKCVEWGPFVDTGSLTDTLNYTVPLNGCPGQVIMTGTEDAGRTPGDDYGYRFIIDLNGVNAFASDVLINNGALFLFPKGGTTLRVRVFGGDAGGSTPGTWDIVVSMQ